MTLPPRAQGGRRDTLDPEAALSSLTVRFDGEVAVITREAGAPLLGAPTSRASQASIAPGVYARTPSTAARARLLAAAATLAPRVEVHAPTVSEGTWRGRLAIDLPRRVWRAVGLSSAEPGDRLEGGRFAHAFFDDEAIVEEAARAGLRFVARRGAWVTLERTDQRTAEAADTFRRELVRAVRAVRTAERLRRGSPPEEAVEAMRATGRRAARRGPIGRARLRRAIFWVDAAYPGGPNCFRRTLVEVALDAGAAGETLVFGLDVGRTGHVAFKDSEERAFDVTFELDPREPRD